MEDDLYEILGVLPTAEDIVITAAYRVLAQRYYPDPWGSLWSIHRSGNFSNGGCL
jgi:DnaJ-class molecular chaperone